MAVSGVMMAQTPTVTKVWSQLLDATQAPYNSCRYGTGYQGKVYYNDKGANKVMVTDGTNVSVFATVPTELGAIGTGISVDDAGNVLVNTGFPNGTSAKSFIAIKADGTQMTKILLPDVDGWAASDTSNDPGRNDGMGRVAGDMFSEQGAIFYTCGQNNTAVRMVYVQNGEYSEGDFSFFTSATLTSPMGTFSIAQPLYGIEDLLDAGDDAVNMCAERTRSVGGGAVYVYDGAKWVANGTLPPNESTNDGFDVFTLNGVDYNVVPYKFGGNTYSGAFEIADTEGNVLFTSENLNGNTGYTNGNGLTARVVSPTKVEIYQWNPMNGKSLAAMYTVELPATGDVDPLYLAGNVLGNGWNPGEPVEFGYENGKYVLDLGVVAGAEFKISTTKGTWDEFNAGVLGLGDQNTQVKTGTFTLIEGKSGNIVLPTGEFALTVDLTTKELTVAGTVNISAPAVTDVYVRGDVNGWGVEDAWKFKFMETEGSTNVYNLVIPKETTLDKQFKIADANWGAVNFGAASENNTIVMGPAYPVGPGGANLTTTGLSDVTLVFKHSGDPDVPSTLQVTETQGVANLEFEADANAVYYNLQGVEVKAENLNAGMYVKVMNGKATKVMVK